MSRQYLQRTGVAYLVCTHSLLVLEDAFGTERLRLPDCLALTLDILKQIADEDLCNAFIQFSVEVLLVQLDSLFIREHFPEFLLESLPSEFADIYPSETHLTEGVDLHASPHPLNWILSLLVAMVTRENATRIKLL